MPHAFLECPSEDVFNEGFGLIRTEFEVTVGFAPEVTTVAAASSPSMTDRGDARGLDLITIDPPGSRDLDQAFTARRAGDGYVVNYAIADVAAFVDPGSSLDSETHRRGVTFYAPDENAPLHPEVLGAGAASLLPNQDTPALLWTIHIDDRGELVDATMERSIVSSRAALSYQEVAADLATDDPDPRHILLREIGLLRLKVERERGGVSLNLPSQEVVDVGDRYVIEYRETLPVEDWNAQISLLTGMAAAQIMVEGGVGILRTLPAPDGGTIEWLRRTSNALSVSYPKNLSYPDWVRGLNSGTPVQAALQSQAARAFRGAGYISFDGDIPLDHKHAALATTYSHVTAPLRRLIDRYTNEIVLALCERRRPEDWALDMLEQVPDLMADAGRRSRSFERALVDFAEVMVLSGRTGERFEAVVTDRRNDRVTLQLTDPAVIARIRNDDVGLGAAIMVKLTDTDPVKRHLDFTVVTDH